MHLSFNPLLLSVVVELTKHLGFEPVAQGAKPPDVTHLENGTWPI